MTLIEQKAKKHAKRLHAKMYKQQWREGEAEYINAKYCSLMAVNELIDWGLDLIPTSSHKDIMQFKNLINHHLEYYKLVKKYLQEL